MVNLRLYSLSKLKEKKVPRKLKKEPIHFSKKDQEISVSETMFNQNEILQDLLNGQDTSHSKDKKEFF